MKVCSVILTTMILTLALIAGALYIIPKYMFLYYTIHQDFITTNKEYNEQDTCIEQLMKTVRDRSVIAVKDGKCWEIEHKEPTLHDWE